MVKPKDLTSYFHSRILHSFEMFAKECAPIWLRVLQKVRGGGDLVSGIDYLPHTRHYPTTKFTQVADTPESRRIADQQKLTEVCVQGGGGGGQGMLVHACVCVCVYLLCVHICIYVVYYSCVCICPVHIWCCVHSFLSSPFPLFVHSFSPPSPPPPSLSLLHPLLLLFPSLPPLHLVPPPPSSPPPFPTSMVCSR